MPQDQTSNNQNSGKLQKFVRSAVQEHKLL